MLTRKLLMVLGGALLIPQAASRAEVLTFAMEGPITFKDDRLGLLDFAEVGQRAVYTFSYDTEADDSHLDPSIGSYLGLSGSLLTNDRVFPTTPPAIVIQKSNLFDIQCTTILAGQSARLMLRLSDWDNTAIPTADLPTTSYALPEFENAYFQFTLDFIPAEPPDVYFTRLTFGGEIDRFYIVPEPASAVLVGLGVASVIRRRR